MHQFNTSEELCFKLIRPESCFKLIISTFLLIFYTALFKNLHFLNDLLHRAFQKSSLSKWSSTLCFPKIFHFLFDLQIQQILPFFWPKKGDFWCLWLRTFLDIIYFLFFLDFTRFFWKKLSIFQFNLFVNYISFKLSWATSWCKHYFSCCHRNMKFRWEKMS